MMNCKNIFLYMYHNRNFLFAGHTRTSLAPGIQDSGVAIGGSAGSTNRGPRPLGAPDRGHNLFSLQDAKNQDSEKKLKSAHWLSQRRPVLTYCVLISVS